MEEGDTFKRLKGLTRDEAFDIFNECLLKIQKETGEGKPFPLSVAYEEANKILNPYGWNTKMLFRLDAGDFS